MATCTLQLTPSLRSSSFNKPNQHQHQHHHLFRIFPTASLSFSSSSSSSSSSPKTRRQFISEIPLSIAASSFLLQESAARSEEAPLSEWERVYLPIDPGVVLLDIAFVPDDPTHGTIDISYHLNFSLLLLFLYVGVAAEMK